MEAQPRRLNPFDPMAEDYDASFTNSALGKCLRALVWERLDAAFVRGSRVLELGCGTGEDAVHLARRGLEVLATDASESMLRIARRKAEQAGCAERVRFCRIPMDQLGSELAGGRFEGVYSNFGAVNCVRRLEDVVVDVARLLTPGAGLVWVVLGRYVPTEWAWFLARGEWRQAFRRLKKDGANWRGMRIHYPTPRELKRALIPYFSDVQWRPLGLALPPSYASRWLEKAPRSLAALTRLERATQTWQPLAAIADHYIIEARRAEQGRCSRHWTGRSCAHGA